MIKTNNIDTKGSLGKHIKRVAVILLACAVSLSSVGCGSKKKEDNDGASQQVAVVSDDAVSDTAVIEEVDEISENSSETESETADTDVITDDEKATEDLAVTSDAEEKTDVNSQNDLEAVQNSADEAVDNKTDVNDIVNASEDSEQAEQDSELVEEEEENTNEEIEESNSNDAIQDKDIAENTEAPVNQTTQEVFSDDSSGNSVLSLTQRNSINMLNYMTVIAQEINASKGNQLRLESIYSSLYNNIYPNAVDVKTQAQITNLMDTIESFRMIAVKRERLNFIYEQNRAQALRQAIPSPVALLSAVQSGNYIKAAASVLYMAIDAKASYDSAKTQADLQFVKDGWELDDSESAALHNSAKNRGSSGVPVGKIRGRNAR